MYDLFKEKDKKNLKSSPFPIKVKKTLIFNHYQWKNLIKVHYNTY
jgi:hypothetical protein